MSPNIGKQTIVTLLITLNITTMNLEVEPPRRHLLSEPWPFEERGGQAAIACGLEVCLGVSGSN